MKNDDDFIQKSWSPNRWSQNNMKSLRKPYVWKTRLQEPDEQLTFACFEDRTYLTQERIDLNASGVNPDINQTNTRGQF